MIKSEIDHGRYLSVPYFTQTVPDVHMCMQSFGM